MFGFGGGRVVLCEDVAKYGALGVCGQYVRTCRGRARLLRGLVVPRGRLRALKGVITELMGICVRMCDAVDLVMTGDVPSKEVTDAT